MIDEHRRRGDVQGLRGLAVLLVVACHTGLPVRGGFIGVDAFFVVSGFVIATELLVELERSGTVRLRDFYARRVRRLLPTLAVVTVVVLGLTALLLNPFLRQDVAIRTAAAGTGFVANVYLYRHVGYFDAWQDERNPFLHLWSLSVEEQFYVVLPVVALVVWRLGRRAPRRTLGAVIGVASAVSLVLAWLCTSGRSPLPVQAPVRFAFYGAPTRAWELGAGVLLAVWWRDGARADAPPVGDRAAAAAGWLGLVLLVGWAVVLDPATPFPGLTAVPPVAGTVLLLVAVGRGRAAGMLEAPAWRWLGDRSYGWYLWHWPAVVFAQRLWPTVWWPQVAAGFGSVVLAAAGYRLFEDPIRRRRDVRGVRALGVAVGCTAVALVAVGLATAGMRGGYGLTEPAGWYDYPYGHDNGCLLYNRDLPNDWREEACTRRVPDARGVVLVVGDQHADAVAEAVWTAAQPQRLDVAEWTRAGCPYGTLPVVGYPRCGDWQADVRALVARLRPVLVVIANRSPDYVGDVRGTSALATDAAGRHRPSDRADALRAWRRSLTGALDDLHRRRVPVLLVATGPDLGPGFPREQVSVLQPHARPLVRPLAAEHRRRDDVVAVERAVVAGRTDVRLVDPFDLLCGRQGCPSTAPDGRWRYHDRADLTAPEARRLAPRVAAALRALLPAAGNP